MVNYDYEKASACLSKDLLESRSGRMWKYKELLPIKLFSNIVTLEEGNTPLLPCHRLANEVGHSKLLFIKDESRNPTWSFKDRLCSSGVSKAKEFGAKVVAIASTGNAGASMAAYGNRAGIDRVIFTVGHTRKSFIALMKAYSAKVVPVNTARGREILLKRCVGEFGWNPLCSYTQDAPTGNPYAVEGYKTIAFEIAEQLEWRVPDVVFVPSCQGEGLFGIWKGFVELQKIGLCEKTPRMVAVEPFDSAPLSYALETKSSQVKRISAGRTIATSLGCDSAGYQALKCLRDSNGGTERVTDAEMESMRTRLASTEGLYAELSSAAAVAGFKKALEDGTVDRDECVVCVLTSSGMKDQDESFSSSTQELRTIEPVWAQFEEFMKEYYDVTL